jgi:hypothetical protein
VSGPAQINAKTLLKGNHMPHRVLILGASYGSLLGIKLLMAGHRVTLVCTAPTASLINHEGAKVRFPLRGHAAPAAKVVEVASRDLPGVLDAAAPGAVDPAGYDLIVLGMQESQYGAPGVRELMARIARSRKPCLAIMNMPPLTYLRRLPGIAADALLLCYTDASVWDGFDPALMTLASPDPQAFRPPEAPKNVLEVGLPTNFKAARFESEVCTAILRRLEADIDAARFQWDGESIEIPVKLKVHDSLFVPLAKWPMLIAGNYRCVKPHDMIPIREAVHGNLDESRRIYEWVASLCKGFGADANDLVPFEKYAQAASSLGRPSSAARALFNDAEHIERVDSLVRHISRQRGLHCDALREIVAIVDDRLRQNRARRAVPADCAPQAVPA